MHKYFGKSLFSWVKCMHFMLEVWCEGRVYIGFLVLKTPCIVIMGINFMTGAVGMKETRRKQQ